MTLTAFKNIIIVLNVSFLTVASSWLVNFYLLGIFIDIAPYTIGNNFYLLEIFLTSLLYFSGSLFAIKLTRLSPIIAALPVGLTGLIFYYIELGGLDCLGVCGMPLWYDLVSFFKHIIPSVLAGVFFLHKHRSRALLSKSEVNTKHSNGYLNRLLKLPSLRSVYLVCSLLAISSMIWVSFLFTNISENVKSVSIYSKELKEQRKVTVFLPTKYSHSDRTYDVLYTLDGENLQHNYLAAATAKILAELGVIPELIIVAINGQGKRGRDFRVKGAVDINGRDSSGEAYQFQMFLENELVPHIAKNFRTGDRKLIAGHSYGGLFTAYSFTEHSNSFDGFFSFSPSFHDSASSVDSFKESFNRNLTNPTFIYLNLGLEGGIMRDSFKQVERIVNNNHIEKLHTKVSYYSLPHALIMIPGYFDALTEFYQ